jgi:hypothetical protein
MMTDSRWYHTATLLQNGKVLLAGGIDNAGSGASVATAELYDPDTGTFTATGSMTTMRAEHSSTALLDGTILIAGGLPNISLSGVTNTAEIYDSNTGRFTATGNLVSGVSGHTATRLKDGHVLIAGGVDENGESNAAELYNPATRTFSAVGNLNVARAGHTATLLSDGTVLIAGGLGSAGNSLPSAELYNPETQTFTLLSAGACPGSAGCMTTARAYHSATRLLDGTVLLACGSNIANQSVLGSTEIYNPQTKAFSAGPATTPKTGHTATLLQRAPTTIALTSSSNPSTAGQKITLTATVKTGNAVTPTGSVSLLDGTNVLQTTGLQASNKGVATFSSESLSVGPHSLTAQYSGDGTYGKSTSSILVQKVNTQATTTTLRSSLNPSNDGQLVTFIATVTPASSGTPTGSVIFRNNGAQLSTVGLNGNTATYSTSSLGPGGNPITATYTGDASFASSGSPVLIQNVAKLSATISLGSNPNPSTLGQIVVITATVSSTGNPQPSGTVLFRDGKKILETAPLISGVASSKVSNLGVGSHSLTGTYSGDLTHADVTSAPIVQQVTTGAATVSLSSSSNPSLYGQNVTFTAAVSSGSGTPTGTVTFSDTSSQLATKTLNAGVAALTIGTLSAGTHQVRATYSGDANHAKATSSLLRQVVNKIPTTTALNSAPNPSKVGQIVIFTATVFNDSGGSPTGRVTFLDGVKVLGKSSLSGGVAALSVSSLVPGPHDVTASYGGDSNFTGSTSPVLVQTVAGLVTPAVVLTVRPSTANAGDSVTFTATVSYPGGPVPTGSITISDVTNGAKIYGVASLKKGVGIATNSTMAPGSYNLVATYGGDGGIHYTGAQSDSAPLRILGESQSRAGIAISGAPNHQLIPVRLTTTR